MKLDKDLYKELKAWANECGDVFVATEEQLSSQKELGYSGISIAFTPAVPGTNCRMLEVAVSYCSPNDKYKRKIGKCMALSKLYSGQYITLPLGQMLQECGPEEVKQYLLKSFNI